MTGFWGLPNLGSFLGGAQNAFGITVTNVSCKVSGFAPYFAPLFLGVLRMKARPDADGSAETLATRLNSAIRDWPLRALKGWSVKEAIEFLPSLAHVHVDTISRVLDGRTRNPQRGSLRAIAAQLGVTESWLRHGQEELALAGNRSLTRLEKRHGTRSQDNPPERSLLASVLQEVNRFPDPVARVRVFRAAADAMIKAAVEEGEVLSTGYGALSELDTWMATERWRARAAAGRDNRRS